MMTEHTHQNSEDNSTLVPSYDCGAYLSLECVKEIETKHNRPCDVTLEVCDEGKKFRAHREILVESSPFFEKLFNSDMKESKEGVVRLKLLRQSVLENVLEFVYTGSVEILAPQHAEELIVAADYLFLSNLKNFAGQCLQKLVCVSNCLSYLDFFEQNQCEELIKFTKDLIHVNFPVVAECQEFLNLTSEEVERWISSDEINVSSEEEVFEIICRWIEHNKGERSPKFNELFRHVRLIYLSPENLSKKVKKNSFVKKDKQCVTSVKSAISFLRHPRKSVNLPRPQSMKELLGKDVIVIRGNMKNMGFYLPDTNTWYQLPKCPSKPNRYDVLVSRGDKVDKFNPDFNVFERYDPLLNQWTS